MIFIATHITYTHFELGLFSSAERIDFRSDDKRNISKNFVPLLNELCTQHALSIHDVSFIVVNQGPGPFATLRSLIASVNGINFAAHTPLVGIDGLKALFLESRHQTLPTIALLNAFGSDIYYCYQDNATLITGYKNIDMLLHELKPTHQSWNFIGNGTTLYAPVIREILGDQALISDDVPQTASFDFIAQQGLKQWNDAAHVYTESLYPLYLKQNTIAPLIT